jgi:hypothetical protein
MQSCNRDTVALRPAKLAFSTAPGSVLAKTNVFTREVNLFFRKNPCSSAFIRKAPSKAWRFL